MTEPNFKPGDFVELKSGGPKMVVDSLTSGGCHCTWFSGSKQNRGYFSKETLKPYEGDK